MKLKLVKGVTGEDKLDNVTKHSDKVSLQVVSSWASTNHIVCADSFFDSVTTAKLTA